MFYRQEDEVRICQLKGVHANKDIYKDDCTNAIIRSLSFIQVFRDVHIFTKLKPLTIIGPLVITQITRQHI